MSEVSPSGEGGGGDPAGLLADLAREAYSWARALDTARLQLTDISDEKLMELSPGKGRQAPTEDPQDLIEEMLRSSADDVVLITPGADAGWRWPVDLVSLLNSAASAGSRVRLLLGSPVRSTTRLAVAHLDAAGAEIRISRGPDQAILVVDHTVALLPGVNGTPPPTAYDQVELVHVLRELADLLWCVAAPLEQDDPAEAGMAPGRDVATRQLHRRILTLMAEGAKDEAIARLLGMSVRTCRRHIAEIMARLQSVSRFQAGTNAVRFGLIDVGINPAQQR